MYIEVNHIQIHYEVLGKGKPIILLNPDSKNTGMMKFIASKLKNQFKVYIFDRRCCGKSQNDCDLTYEESAKDVEEFIKKLNIKKPILLGCSGGGRVALNVAIDDPNIISKLILCSSIARPNSIKKPKYAVIMEKIPYYPGKKNNERFENLLKDAKEITADSLQGIKVPALIFNGGKKDIVPFDEAKYISDNIDHSKLIILKDEGHCNYIMNNVIFYDELFQFLNR